MKAFKLLTALIFTIAINIHLQAQIPVPYENNFNYSADTVGWHHYASQGNDDWEFGVPTGFSLNTMITPPRAIGTNLEGNMTSNARMYYETPFFNLSDTVNHYMLVLGHRYQFGSYAGGNISYSIDSGLTWHVLNGTTSQKRFWYNTTSASGLDGEAGWTTNTLTNYAYGYHLLDTVAGHSAVKFRLKSGCGNNGVEGWLIDYFAISKAGINLSVYETSPTHSTRYCPTYTVNTTIVYSSYVTGNIDIKTKYYWSTDAVFDGGDVLLTTQTTTTNGTLYQTKTFAQPPNLAAGTYYVFVVADPDNTVAEIDETDNLGFTRLIIDSVRNLPLISDFENSVSEWTKGGHNEWEMLPGNKHIYTGTHLGNGAWRIFHTDDYYKNYLESPLLNMATEDSTVISLWLNLKTNIVGYPYDKAIQYSTGCNGSWNNVSDLYRVRDNNWDFYNFRMPAAIDTLRAVKFRIFNGNGYDHYNDVDMQLDDIYIGKAKPDLSIEKDKLNRYTSSLRTSDTLKYYFYNSGLKAAPQSYTAFYWSADSIYDATDFYLGTKLETPMPDTSRIWKTFVYTKPTTAVGKYYILYSLDTANTISEMREYNNQGYFVLYQNQPVTVPYINDFETQIDSWRHNSTLGKDEWVWTVPNKTLFDTAFSGVKAWVTNDTGFVSSMTRMHLYSPIFDLSSSSSPVMEFDMKITNDGSCSCASGSGNMTYSTDGGATWKVLDTLSQSYNRWYYPMEYEAYGGIDRNYYMPNTSQVLFEPEERTFASLFQYNGRDAERNTRYIIDIRSLKGYTNIQFRFNFATLTENLPNSTTAGILLDNFQIIEKYTDLTVNYKKALMISSVARSLKFTMNIKNQGNYITVPCATNFYLSADTLLDAGDLLLGQDNIPAIRPDLSHYVSLIFNTPLNLNIYRYLLYDIDVTHTNAESVETNNLGYWPLALDSISDYPYYQSFNDTVLNGWASYVKDVDGIVLTDQYRFRNIVAPGEYLYSSGNASGKMFTDQTNSGQSIYWIPYWNLETPAFDFSDRDTVFMSFDFLCYGRSSDGYKDGGNMQFSIDGGYTWGVLTTSFGQATNWYNYPLLDNLNNQPGWSGVPTGFDSTTFNLTFLKGKKNVVFRYVFRSNTDPFGNRCPGMNIDDFRIIAPTTDYVAMNIMETVLVEDSVPTFDISYSILNNGQSLGRSSVTKFYWSADNVFDASDQLIETIPIAPINGGITYNENRAITFPQPVTQPVYYLFYFTDVDSNIVETNENNNLGSFKIMFNLFPNYVAPASFDTANALMAQPQFTVNYSIINDEYINGIGTQTEFYWSVDSIYQASDPLIKTLSEMPISARDTLFGSTSITYPTPIIKKNYFLFYKADAGNMMTEVKENDNMGSFRVVFDYGYSVEDNNASEIQIYVNNNNLYLLIQGETSTDEAELIMVNPLGQIVQNTQIKVNKGLNKYELPQNLPNGVYLLSVKLNGEVFIRRISMME